MFFLLNTTWHLPRPQKATALVPTFCGRDYGRDVVPLSPAVREANLWHQVAPRDFPWVSTQIDAKKLHHCIDRFVLEVKIWIELKFHSPSSLDIALRIFNFNPSSFRSPLITAEIIS